MKKNYSMMVLLALMIQICLISNQGLSSESADDSQPEILLSRVLPVVNEELTLSVKADADKPALLEAMKGHVLAEGTLMGTYER